MGWGARIVPATRRTALCLQALAAVMHWACMPASGWMLRVLISMLMLWRFASAGCRIVMSLVLLLFALVVMFKFYTMILVSRYHIPPRHAATYALVQLGIIPEPQGHQCDHTDGRCEL